MSNKSSQGTGGGDPGEEKEGPLQTDPLCQGSYMGGDHLLPSHPPHPFGFFPQPCTLLLYTVSVSCSQFWAVLLIFLHLSRPTSIWQLMCFLNLCVFLLFLNSARVIKTFEPLGSLSMDSPSQTVALFPGPGRLQWEEPSARSKFPSKKPHQFGPLL